MNEGMRYYRDKTELDTPECFYRLYSTHTRNIRVIVEIILFYYSGRKT